MRFSILTLASVATTASAFTSSFLGSTTPVSRAVANSDSALCMKYKVAVVGGGPSGACAAEIFAQEKGIDTVLFERKLDNAKPCGGAIPLCMIGEFNLPESVVDRKVRSCRLVARDEESLCRGSSVTYRLAEYIYCVENYTVLVSADFYFWNRLLIFFAPFFVILATGPQDEPDLSLWSRG